MFGEEIGKLMFARDVEYFLCAFDEVSDGIEMGFWLVLFDL